MLFISLDLSLETKHKNINRYETVISQHCSILESEGGLYLNFCYATECSGWNIKHRFILMHFSLDCFVSIATAHLKGLVWQTRHNIEGIMSRL